MEEPQKFSQYHKKVNDEKKEMNKKEKAQFRKSSCDGKLKHRSKLAAEYYLNNISHRQEDLEVYFCIFCSNYHLGHRIGRNRK